MTPPGDAPLIQGDARRLPLASESVDVIITSRTYHRGSGQRSPTAGPNGRQGERPADIGSRHRRVGGWWEYPLEGWTAPPTRRAVVLDPFCGSGTVPMVARALGRWGIGVELNADYGALAHWRVWESGDAHKVAARARNRPVRPPPRPLQRSPGPPVPALTPLDR